MQKVINENRIEFYNEETNEMIMCMGFVNDEFCWWFRNSDEITITEDMELFGLLKYLMQQQYDFDDPEIAKNFKDDNKLIWYSDCSYDPDSESSVNAVSYLTIVYEENIIKLKCIKPIDSIINRADKSHIIEFSPGGNGRHARNLKTGRTLQNDLIISVYQKLLSKEETKKKNKTDTRDPNAKILKLGVNFIN